MSTEELGAGVELVVWCGMVLGGRLAVVAVVAVVCLTNWMSCCWMKRVHQLFVATKSSMFCWRAIASARLIIL